MFAKFIAVTAVYALSVLLTVGIMIYGWGLEPLSWWWIIGGGVAGRIILEMIGVLTKESKTEGK